mgnify:CR=1 FL=1
MIRIGIIGGIGSGKSFVAKLFNSPVFNADKEVNYLYNNSKECFIKLKKKVPKFINSFPVKKKQLISAINADQRNLRKISSVVHPLVRRRMKKFIIKNKNCKIIILDIPLLVENKLNKKGDVLIFVKSKKSKIIKRLKKRSNYDVKIIKKLTENQILISKKIKLSDYVVDNNFSLNIMKKKIKLLKNKILNERNNT